MFDSLEERRLLAVLWVGGGGPYDTIQSAVDAARPGDVVQISGGEYAESVDLSRMGVARGGSVGDLVIRGESAGQAVISPPGNTAFFNSAPFSGDLQFERLTLSGSAGGAGTRGLDLDQLVGDLTVEELTFQELADGGLELSNATGDVRIAASRFDRLGNSDQDDALRVSELSGAGVITANEFRDVRGTAIRLINTGDQEAAWLVDDNEILGDGSFFQTTRNGIAVLLEGETRTDVTLEENVIDGLATAAIQWEIGDNAELQTRWDVNSIGNIQGPAMGQVVLRDQAFAAVLAEGNAWLDALNAGLAFLVQDTAELRAIVQFESYSSIGDGLDNNAPEDAVTIATTPTATGRVQAFLYNNSFSTVTGSGVRIRADGSAAVNAIVQYNDFSETNTRHPGGAVAIEHATADSTASVSLRLDGNTALQNEEAAYALHQRGAGVMQLEGAAANASDQIAGANFGQPVMVSGTVNLMAPGRLDASQPLLLGDLIWWDDGDGLQNQGEGGVGAVVVRLSGVESNGGAAVQRITQSDAFGKYLFPGLAAGQYTLTLDLPFALRLATANQTPDEARDNDFDPASAQATVVLVAAQDQMTVDAGLWRTWQNPRNPLDVDDDGQVIPLDALVLINDINARQPRPLPIPPVPPNEPPPYLDVNGNGDISPQDVLIVINDLNGAMAGGAGEGEAVAESPVGPITTPTSASPVHPAGMQTGTDSGGEPEKKVFPTSSGRWHERPLTSAETALPGIKRPWSQPLSGGLDEWFAQLAVADGINLVMECP
jgi:hypothetical protein